MFSHRTNWRRSPNALTRAIEEARTSGQKIVNLTVSNPTEAGVRPDAEIVLAALANPGAMHYDPQPRGLLGARQAVCRYYRESQEVFDLDPERLILTTSTSEAYSYVFRLLCNAGDQILVPKPSYPLFEFLADLADVRLVPYPLLYDHGWQMDFAGLRAALTPRSRAVVVVHPNNPTGSFVKPREAAQLAQICAAWEMAIIADEVFLDYPDTAKRSGAGARATFAFSGVALTFTLSGLSKICALPQMKLAWIVTSGPEPLVRTAVERLDVIADTYLSPSTPIQLAAPEFLALRRAMQ